MPRRLRVRPSAVVSVLGGVLRHPANRGARLRSILRVLRFQARGRVLRKPTTVPYARSSKIVARVDDGASRRAAYAPFPDYPEMAVWTQQLGDGDLFVDVGASVGLYSLVATEQGAELICLEPLPRAREQLVANLALIVMQHPAKNLTLSRSSLVCLKAKQPALQSVSRSAP